MNNSRNITKLILVGMMFYLMLYSGSTLADPSGAQITFNSSVTPAVATAGSITTAGGSFTTLLLNATTQNPRWKAYVGNISGELSLADANDQIIYDWQLSVITGEVYASRNNSIDWGNIQCADRATIVAEDAALNITSSNDDSINSTFNDTVHAEFFVGGTQIAESTCPAIATYVNSSRQATSTSADFQEILLEDTVSLVYATLLENDQLGYDIAARFDFQMIVAENELNPTPTTYYFFAELG